MIDVSTDQLLTECTEALNQCQLTDYFRLNKLLHKSTKSPASSTQNRDILRQLLSEIKLSISKVELRNFDNNGITYPDELPVSQKKDEIKKALEDNQVIIVCGETGSGKTTQLPKICLESGYGKRGLIGHTQPRRLAARAVADRLAEELRSPIGQTIGYKMRFTDHLSATSQVKLMTDGILLSETQHDPYLNQYDCLIIDEAHERSLNIDFILGYLKQLLPKRPELKLIITSATIDPERFSRHFDNAPIIEVSGRTYPVDILYRPLQQPGSNQKVELPQGIADAVDELTGYGRGDILVFLSGERDIKEAASFLRKQNYDRTEILSLIARLSISEQAKIFSPSSKRRIILSTNVAETSLTVPGIKYVIDSGLARISRYSWKNKIQRLPIEAISQASANQRKGRCGRTSHGICIRLYSEEDFLQRDEFTQPEIQRTNLASVILQMENNHLGNIENFPFIEAPDPRLIKDGYRLLFELNAINTHSKLSKTGKTLSKLPIEPRFARILVEANIESSLTECLIIISGLSIQDPRERPIDRRDQAYEKHRHFEDRQSDFITLLNLWTEFHNQKQLLSNNKLKNWCIENFISWPRMREWLDTHNQIRQLLKQLKFSFNQSAADYDSIHRALLSGLLSHVGIKTDESEYLTTRNRKFFIFPGSTLNKSKPKYVMSAEIMETSKVYAHFVAKIELDWVEQKAGHVLKHTYNNPHWSKKSSTVKAYRQSSLYGLIINPGKLVNYGNIKPAESRNIFIQSALVEGNFETKARFFKHNHKLIEDIQSLEDKQRRRDILIDDSKIFDFYDRHLPEHIHSGALLHKWLQESDSNALFLDYDLLTSTDTNDLNLTGFPDHISINDVNYPLEYKLNPSGTNDGITIITPASGIMNLDPLVCEWLIPGLLHDKVTALIRSLPKKFRRYFVPAPDFATACMNSIKPASLPLISSISSHLTKITGVEIPYDAWRPELINDHLFFNFRVLDTNNKVLDESRNLAELQEKYKDHKPENHNPVKYNEIDKADISTLDTPTKCFDAIINGVTLKLYPALTKEGTDVALRSYYSEKDALQARKYGLRQLYLNHLSFSLSSLKKQFANLDKICIYLRKVDTCNNLTNDILSFIIDQLFTSKATNSSIEFHNNIASGVESIPASCDQLSALLSNIASEYNSLTQQINKLPLQFLDTSSDISSQLSSLIYPGFILETPAEWLQHYPRFLKAIRLRIDKLQSSAEDDRRKRLELASLWSQYLNRLNMISAQNKHSDQLAQYRWMLEEYRVSLFAQSLRTSIPVSSKRLKEYWTSIQDI